MNTEEMLKKIILERYGSIREFTIQVSIPYSTLDTILKRGIQKATVSNVLVICSALNISADALAEGRIEPVVKRKSPDYIDLSEQMTTAITLIHNNGVTFYLDGKEASKETIDYIADSLEICLEMAKKRQKP